ncbi:MAG: hypothetical protein HKM05_11520 [Spirochaetales bacterium]|nr:hypothetical protein [Spirochaetales bacterium]
MITITVELFFMGFLVAVVAYHFIPYHRSQFFAMELGLSILGSFLGTLTESLMWTFLEAPMLAHLIVQFLAPFLGAVLVLLIYRMTNNPLE